MMNDKFLESVMQLIKEVDEILAEKKLTKAEYSKKKEIAKALEKDEPNMPDDKKYAIATATAKRVAEQDEQSPDLNRELENYFTRKDDEEEGRFDDASTEDLLNPDIPAPWEKK
tara:strand:- start:233 stop:574 length:342 start_codon:yes stop_codon:yes gene_type:complete